jgi:hypothetical protein
MGLEALCNATWDGITSEGKALLESDYILFRGDFRLKVLFADLKTVRAVNGALVLKFKGGPATLHLGAAAEKWAKKILRPPSRLQKLGIMPGIKIAIAGPLDPAFTGEVREQLGSLESSDLVFLALDSADDLAGLHDVVHRLPAAAALWIIYPKGTPAIRETDVISGGRAIGLTDIKVVSFSPTHTGLKFVRPKAVREKARLES